MLLSLLLDLIIFFFFFFFSSRRRHTRLVSDWSSDVCSSDLSRHDSPGRARRYVHAALMLISDAGFVATEMTAPGRDDAITDPGKKRLHRTLAITSMGMALGGYGMMLVWK